MKSVITRDYISNKEITPSSKSVRWILAHDIRDPKRLRKVWRYLRKEGVRLQYSIYMISGTRKKMQEILDQLAEFIDEKADDIRVYPIGENTRIWGLGLQFSDGGNILCDEVIDKLRVHNSDIDDEQFEDKELDFE